jgi:hypothetical protein
LRGCESPPMIGMRLDKHDGRCGMKVDALWMLLVAC